jgi:tetratricopeptide (TPR) repeat protein
MTLSRRTTALFAAAWLCACGGEDASQTPTEPAAHVAPPRDLRAPQDDATRERQGFPPQLARGQGPALERAREALERGAAAAATAALLALGDDLEVELLRARLAALEADGIGAVRRIEAARAVHPDQAEVYATAAEIHAAAGRLASAEQEVREGLVRCGPAPALSRARGVLALARTGGARSGLEHLLDARALDPALPFLEPALLQAHLLLGRAALAESLALDALGHARAALLLEPADVEARTLLADAQSAAGELDAALETFEGLLADGAAVRDTLALLCQRAATAALVEGRRELALERYLRARELGLAEADLGFGASLLIEAAEGELERGVAALESGDHVAAGAHLERALRLDPQSLPARNHLAVVHFLERRYAQAAAQWRELLERARAQDIELPEPVELNLAKALALDGHPAEARALLEAWLAHASEGSAADSARALLAELDAR